MPCQYKKPKWIDAKFYVVDIPGPAVVGLPTLLSIVAVNVDAMAKRETMDMRDDKQKRVPNDT